MLIRTSKTQELKQRLYQQKMANDAKLALAIAHDNKLKELNMNTAGWTSNDPEQPSAKVKTALQHYLEQQKQMQQAELDVKYQSTLAQAQSFITIGSHYLPAATGGTLGMPITTTMPIITNTYAQPGMIYSPDAVVEPPASDLIKKDFYSKLKALAAAEPHKVAPRVPDRVEPIIAYRAWRAMGQAMGSVGYDGAWPVKLELKATCGMGYGPPKHQAPVFNCDCGIWAFKTQADLEKAIGSYLDGSDIVIGQVYLWGRLIECELGYRAEFAYPKEIWCLKDEHEQLGMAYNVPVRTLA